MRHRGSAGLLVMLGALTPGAGTQAAPLDFLFGGPPLAARPAYRLRRRPAPPLVQSIPLPVPRPHFPGDPPRKAEGQPPAVAPGAPSAKPGPPPKPAEPKAATPAIPPEVENPFVAPARETPPAAPPAAPPSPTAAPKESEPAQTTAGPRTPSPPSSPPLQPAPKSTPPAAPSAPAVGPPAPPTPPPKPADLAPSPAPGKPTPPAVAPSGATLAFTPRAPEDDPQCPTRLASQKVGIEPTTLGPQPDPRCTVVEPVHLDDVTMPDGSKVAFPEHPTIACVTADSFSSYVRDMLSPLAKGTFGAPVAAVWTGPGLECRSRDHVFGAKLSAHGQGLAIDIAKLKLTDGRVIEVGTPNTPAEAAFETAARAGACGYFHTVLGPGSDSYHRTHWHFDLEVRGAHGDSKYCK